MLDFEDKYFDLDFLSEDENNNKEKRESKYSLLVVDDDDEVHKITDLILESFNFEGEKLKVFHTYSERETIEFLKKENENISIILLDVVMENDHSGLNVVEYIRNDLKNNLVRIILRTGQPGKAPEDDVIMNYDINDYKSKTELTVQKLYTALYSSLRAYRDLINIKEKYENKQR